MKENDEYFMYSDETGVRITETEYQRYGFTLRNQNEVAGFITELKKVSSETFSTTSPPPEDKRVLAWVEGEKYPFVGYYNQEEWFMETDYLNYDQHKNDIFGEVICWQEIPMPNRDGKCE